MLTQIHPYDFVFIHREAAPLGPPVLEWLIAKVLRKRIIFDFDDAIWLPNTSATNRIAAGLKWHRKTAGICRWSYKISAGNAYLADYAKQYHGDVTVNPTTIDTAGLHNQIKDQATGDLVIGWTGTHSTINYLDALLPVLRDLEAEHRFTFLVISDQKPAFHLNSLQFLPWNKASEREDLLRMHIGVMPLTDDPWARGKCGFKALQYMALGIPAVASPVGVNCDIIRHGENGYLCRTADEWEEVLTKLLEDAKLRTRMGKAARNTVQSRYSVQANRFTFCASSRPDSALRKAMPERMASAESCNAPAYRSCSSIRLPQTRKNCKNETKQDNRLRAHQAKQPAQFHLPEYF